MSTNALARGDEDDFEHRDPDNHDLETAPGGKTALARTGAWARRAPLLGPGR